MEDKSLKGKTIKGTMWSAIDNVTHMGVNFVISIILARLLSPEHYGLIGIISIFTTICTALIDGGFINALIRKKDADEKDYNTVFICNLVVSLFLYGLLFFLSPLIAHFFVQPELNSLLKVGSLVLVVNSFSLVQQAQLIKQIDFKTQTKISFLSTVVSGCVGIIFAFTGFGVWALVSQLLLAAFLKTLLLFCYNKWLPSFQFYKNSFVELFGFGWKMMLSSLLDTLWKDLYQVIIGKFYQPGTLGQYTRANQFSQMFSSNLTSVIQRVTYPVISDIQNDKERMISAYRKIIKLAMSLTFPCMFLLAAVSKPLINCLIGTKWDEAATYLPYICMVGALYPLHAINLNMLKVLGRSDLFLKLEIIKKTIGVVPLFIGAYIGIFPMLYAGIVIGIVNYFMNSYYTGKYLNYSSLMQIRDIAPSIIISLAVTIPIYILNFIPLSSWLVLSLQIVVGLIIYVMINEFSENNEYKELKEIIVHILKK